jgi:hypothetical protein
MKQSDLKKIIKSSLQEIKVERPTSNEEAYNKCLEILGPFQTFILTIDYDTLEEFMTEYHGEGIEEFEDMFGSNYKEFEPIAQQAIRAVEFGDVKPLFLISTDDRVEELSTEYSVSGFNSLVILGDDIGYMCAFLSKFPLKY